MRSIVALALSGFVFAAATPAAADEDERRWSLAGETTVVDLDVFGSSDSTVAYGGGLSFAWGARNWLELGLQTSYLTRPTARFADPKVAGVSGAGLSMYSSLHDVRLAATARLALDPPWYRVRPLVTVRAGAGYRILGNPELFDPTGDFVLALDTQTDVAAFAGGDIGISWRFSEHYQVAVLVGATTSADAQTVGLQLELSRFSYDLF